MVGASPALVRRCPRLAQHALRGGAYAARVFVQAAATFAIGLPTCVLPIAWLLSMAAEAMLQGRAPEDEAANTSRLLPMGWSPSERAGFHRLPYYAFFCVRYTISFLTLGVCITFIGWWRGWRAARGWPTGVALLGLPIVNGTAFARIWFFAEGFVVSPKYDVVFRTVVYGGYVVLGSLVLIAGVTAGDRRRLAPTCFVLWTILPVAHYLLGLIFVVYFGASKLWLRAACVGTVNLIRVVGFDIALWAAARFPDCPPRAAMLVAWAVNAITLGSIQIMQTASPDSMGTCLIFAMRAATEVARNLARLLYGKTEVQIALMACKALCRLMRASKTAPKIAPIVPNEPAASAREEEADRQQVMHSELVSATNLADVLVVLTVASFLLLAAINPLVFETEPWPWQRTLTSAALALAFEFATDCAVAGVVSYVHGGRPDRCRFQDAAFEFLGAAWLVQPSLALVYTLENLVYISVHLCPRARPGTRELFYLGACPS